MISRVISYILSVAAVSGLAAACTDNGAWQVPEVESVSLSGSAVNLTVGQDTLLSVSVVPESLSWLPAEWSVDDAGIVSVDDAGNVLALAAGTATVTVCVDGVADECVVVVEEKKVTSVTLDADYLEMIPGETTVIGYSAAPDDVPCGRPEWSVSPSGVVSVAADGRLTAVKPGDCILTAAVDGITAECEIKVLESREMEAGDIIYSDGSWSKLLVPSKEPVGVIFWVGDPTSDDPLLKEDYPGCTNGLALSLDEHDSPWMSSYEAFGSVVSDWVSLHGKRDYLPVVIDDSYGDFNRKTGYNNTLAIEEFNNAPENASWPVEAVANASAYNEANATVPGGSRWYLPSIKELALMCAGEYDLYGGQEVGNDMTVKINAAMSLIPGAKQLRVIFYWSSSEWNNESAWSNHFYNSYIGANNKVGEDHRTRYVFAF